MKILVTGGSGFIGSAFIRYLMTHTEHVVINLDKLTYAANDACSVYEVNSRRYRFYQKDLTNLSAITQVIESEEPDRIINFAAETHVDRSIHGPNAFFQSNIVGTYNLLQASLAYWQGLPSASQSGFRFHQVSTDEVYGELTDEFESPFTESSPIKPSSPYSASKASADNLVQAWGKTYGMPTLITRSSNNYGPWQYMEKLIPVVINCIVKQEPIPIYGKGDQQRNWLHVDDHVSALYCVLTQGDVGEIYNIGSEDELKNIDLVQCVCRISASLLNTEVDDVLKLITYVEDRQGHDFRYALSSKKIKNELGWEPSISFDAGLAQTIEWYLTYYDER
ncbi:dTDP-glucose 4,6-dehydratase [Neptuniibacter sp. 2_MG-2023]|uniref:dTDP-glucose 4,6-dehydratase n=1 Tax=Neptuniibacter sp. 2_MG-2023 TaxID=3062671 RepID=UPI0026E29776|nr:dTDP-glucose 4,6-dehydratase [Neptuniibacter sp. 2_MG-2023]MDO6514520.1 dTDP-glucose 4,6-dehydratase [Neptuniibacter sp. 2_MG-2023]